MKEIICIYEFQVLPNIFFGPGRGISSTGIARGGQRTILLQHPHRENGRSDGDRSDIEAVHMSDLKNTQRPVPPFRETYHHQQHINVETHRNTSHPISR